MKNTAMQQRLGNEIKAFIDSRRSLQLATLGNDGFPYASYAPFARDEQALFVLLSDIAVHGLNLLHNNQASVLIIEDEDPCPELYARVRVGYQVQGTQLPMGSAPWHCALAALATRHGERPRKLAELADFRLFCLTPLQGRYVKGFGKAYTLTGGTLAGAEIDHLRVGHRARDDQAA